MKNRALLIIEILLLLLAACADSSTELPPPATNNSNVHDTVMASVDSWDSEGNAYTQTYITSRSINTSVFIHDTDVYSVKLLYTGQAPSSYKICKNDSTTIYTPGRDATAFADASDDGIWILETYYMDGVRQTELKLISYSGELLRYVELSQICASDEYITGLRYGNGVLHFQIDDKIILANTDGEKLDEFQSPSYSSSMLFGSEGESFVVNYSKDKVDINHIVASKLELICSIETTDGIISAGNSDYPFFLSDSRGLFGLDIGGVATPIIIWEDCGISAFGLIRVFPMDNGEYLLWCSEAIILLKPTDPSALGEKQILVLATVAYYENTESSIMAFNQASSKYTVVIKDYSDAGSYDVDTATSRLNVDIAAGNHPDLMLLTELSPHAYIKKGYLLDLNILIDEDDEINREDIIIANQLEIEGGIYFLSTVFSIETLTGLHSEFGDRNSWDLAEYLEIERSLPENKELIYNATKGNFLRWMVEGYLSSAIDYENAKCYFDSEEFISILDASQRIRENPEPDDPSLMNFTPGPVRLAEGTLTVASTYVDSVWKLAFYEKLAAEKLSFIGWPTVDGSCGSRILLSAPMGVCSQTSNLDGCWEFMRFILKDYEAYGHMLPTYKPHFSAQIEDATLTENTYGVQLNSSDADKLFELIDAIDKVTFYNEAILSIIDEESLPFFDSSKSASETAAIIQSRVQLYLSEQYS